MSYRRIQQKKKATNNCIRFGLSLRSANQLPAQGVRVTDDLKKREREKGKTNRIDEAS